MAVDSPPGGDLVLAAERSVGGGGTFSTPATNATCAPSPEHIYPASLYWPPNRVRKKSRVPYLGSSRGDRIHRWCRDGYLPCVKWVNSGSGSNSHCFAVHNVPPIGESPLSDAVCGYEQQIVPNTSKERRINTYAIVNGGLELARLGLVGVTFEWAARPRAHPGGWDGGPAPRQQILLGTRPPRHLLDQSPVDLILEDMRWQTPPPQGAWSEVAVGLAAPKNRPTYVLESWDPQATLWQGGPMSKLVTTRWRELGYWSQCQCLCATEVGGAILQTKLLVVRGQANQPSLDWGPRVKGPARPMGNLLTPVGLVPKWAYLDGSGVSPAADRAPMPGKPGAWIRTAGGTRRVEVDEFIRGLGGKAKGPPCFGRHPLRRMALVSTSLFHWEYLLHTLSRVPGLRPPTSPPGVREETHQTQKGKTADAETPFHWAPPDLSKGSPWYQQRVENLSTAALSCADPGRAYQEGLRALDVHRSNYNQEGPCPTRLQLLWWEWPKEHWKDLREGSRMNFLDPPPEGIRDNSPMDEEQIEVACEFVDELVGLGTLRPDPHVKATAPLFCIPKEGQPGQWRVIADMLRGGQNGVVGNDPVYLPRLLHILEDLYEGGYSAVVDASKFFYQFPTHPADQPYLGIKHPRTGELYTYFGAPMGAGNSPALGNRYGVAFLRKVKQEHPHLFQGTLKGNGFFEAFSPRGRRDPALGGGVVTLTADGEGVALIKAFVDDFFIHAPSKEKCEDALRAFLDAAVDCGMLCHPKKLISPRQEVRYCGLIFDTRHTPILKIPQDKLERSQAMIHFTLAQPERRWSRLALSVLAGVLESLAECTPQRVGHTHLRSLHSLIHPEGGEVGLEGYLSYVQLRPEIVADLGWWRDHLQDSHGRVVRAQTSGALVPTFGDGSGTGTGGTISRPGSPMTMWRGQWSPTVFSFSSNWKELTTLLITLETLLKTDPDTVRGAMVFYFTDNSTTYWVCQKGSSRHTHLHEQVVKIRRLETRLACHLCVIHIPGKVIIREGTDGLSRGVWITPLQGSIPREILMPAIFAPLPFDPTLVHHYVSEEIPNYHRAERRPGREDHPRWEGRRWDSTWETTDAIDQLTVWFPPPEAARALISFLLDCYVERPLSTSALLFIPRIMMASWRGLSKKITELPVLHPDVADLAFPPILPIPVTVLYLPPHHRSPPSHNRLDKPPPPMRARVHRRQADQMRRVQPTSGGGSSGAPM